MKKFMAVIGSNFGDEGKGLFTDYLAFYNADAINICFNGGAQKGHTCVTPDGIKHEFHHFGSGTFAGIPTYLTEDYILNPLTFAKEYKELEELGFSPVVFANKNCRITTPYDILLNRYIEDYRNSSRHGSCGMGIYETILRYESNIFLIDDIVNIYIPNRLKELNIPMDYDFFNIDEDESLMKCFYKACAFMYSNVKIVDFESIYDKYNTFICEGAQGLLLDAENTEYFPNLTPSRTGTTNIVKMMRKGDSLEVNYITRCYMTRHGKGRFETEVSNKPYESIYDLTNIDNDYQESLRFGYLDIDLLADTIFKDMNNYKYLLMNEFKINLVITCLDQLTHGIVDYLSNGKYEKQNWRTMIEEDIYEKLPMNNFYVSFGETRNTIRRYSGC